MKHLPNLITCLRILCALALFFVVPFSGAFWTLYLVGGFSDMADGWLARRFGLASKVGALLDSVADLLFLVVLAYLLAPYFTWPLWLVVWLLCIVAVRLGAVLVAWVRFGKVAFLHTYSNKVTGLALFVFPLLMFVMGFTGTAILLCCIASLAAAEELLIMAKCKVLDSEVRSFWVGMK